MAAEDAIRDELVALLRYANKTAISEALGLSPQAVINWSEGKHPSQARLNAIRALYGLPVTPEDETKEPPLAERLEKAVAQLETVVIGVTSLEGIVDRLAAQLKLRLSLDDEDPPAEDAEPQDAADTTRPQPE